MQSSRITAFCSKAGSRSTRGMSTTNTGQGRVCCAIVHLLPACPAQRAQCAGGRAAMGAPSEPPREGRHHRARPRHCTGAALSPSPAVATSQARTARGLAGGRTRGQPQGGPRQRGRPVATGPLPAPIENPLGRRAPFSHAVWSMVFVRIVTQAICCCCCCRCKAAARTAAADRGRAGLQAQSPGLCPSHPVKSSVACSRP
jgi:hypothetical protein